MSEKCDHKYQDEDGACAVCDGGYTKPQEDPPEIPDFIVDMMLGAAHIGPVSEGFSDFVLERVEPKKCEHKYKTEGSDNLPRRMLAKCTCGWNGPVLEGQGRKEHETAAKQWAKHIGWTVSYNPKPIPDRSFDWDYVHDDYDEGSDLCGAVAHLVTAIMEIEEIEENKQ